MSLFCNSKKPVLVLAPSFCSFTVLSGRDERWEHQHGWIFCGENALPPRENMVEYSPMDPINKQRQLTPPCTSVKIHQPVSSVERKSLSSLKLIFGHLGTVSELCVQQETWGTSFSIFWMIIYRRAIEFLGWHVQSWYKKRESRHLGIWKYIGIVKLWWLEFQLFIN